MFNAIGVIARARFMIARNTFWRGSALRKAGVIAVALFLAAVAYGVYQLINLVVRGITSPQFARALAEVARQQPGAGIPTDIQPYLEAVPSIALFLALVVLILTSFSTVLSSLYLSGDIDMLLVAPVPMRAVFVVKFFSGLLLPYLLLFVLLGPALLGFGQALGYGATYFLASVLALALLPLLPFSIGALLVMAVVRVIPARRAREIVGVLGGLIGVSWYLFSQFSRQISQRVATVETLASLQNLDLPVLPSAWAGRALLAAGQGEWLTLAVFGGLYVAVSLGLFAGCLVLAERLYYVGWSNMSTKGGAVKGRRTKDEGRKGARLGERSFVFRLSSLVLPRESAAILYKDLRVFPRDLSNLQQIIFPLMMAGVWTFQLLSTRPEASRALPNNEFQQAAVLLGPAGISFFVCLSLSWALGGPNISREGRGFWLLKAAPISSLRLLLGKLVLAYLPFPVVGTLFVALLSVVQRTPLFTALLALALVLIAGLGVSSISLGLGAAFPRLDWENPNQQSSTKAGCLTPIFYTLYMAIAVGAALGLPLLGTFVPGWAGALAVAGWLIMIAITAVVVWLALSVGAARLDRMEIT